MNNERAISPVGISAVAMLLVGLTLAASAGSLPEGQSVESMVGGTRLVGLVRNVYVQVANNVLLDATRAPATMVTRDTVYFVDVEFPELLPKGSQAIRAQLVDMSDVQVGDIVEIRIAHKDNPTFFPVNEVTRVTQLIAKSNTALARDFARGITFSRRGVSPMPRMLQTNPRLGMVNK